MRILLKITLVVTLICAGLQTTIAQSTKAEKQAAKEAAIKALVEDKNFVFNARFMYPMGGGQKYLDPYYDLQIGKDTVIAYLPYYGVAYSGAGYNNADDNGVKFTTTKFDYTTSTNKNGGWRVTIKPKDVRNTNMMTLYIAPNGNADLSVISNNRGQIRYDGYIIKKDKKK